MRTNRPTFTLGILFVMTLGLWSCRTPEIVIKEVDLALPEQFQENLNSENTEALINWRDYFNDSNLTALIDTALVRNQELNIVLQEIAISNSEVLEKSGEYLPFVDVGVGVGAEKAGRYTRDGAVEHNIEIADGKEFPEPLGDFSIGARASWEVDVWRKLRNAKDAAQLRYLAETEGKNFLVTQLISEIAESYYELMALDNLLIIINDNVVIQEKALAKMLHMKQNARATQLAVNRFEGQLLNTKNQQYAVRQKITETENRLYFLTGSLPGSIPRNSETLMDISIDTLMTGIPSELLENRPDIRQAELNLEASKLDLKVAKASFFPRVELSAGLGYQAFSPSYLLNSGSLIYNTAGEIMAPLINRKALIANFNKASAMQVQSVYEYQQTVLNAYTDVLNQLAKMENYSNSLATKAEEVSVLKRSVEIANSLFQFAKADYVEVLLTQEEVLDGQMELVEIKLQQIHSKVQLYAALGGGWKK